MTTRQRRWLVVLGLAVGALFVQSALEPALAQGTAKIRSIQFTGLRSIDFSEAVAILEKLDPPVDLGADYSVEAIKGGEEAIRKALVALGHPDASVNTEVKQPQPTVADLVFVVTEDPQ